MSNNKPSDNVYDYAVIGLGASGIHVLMAMLEDPYFLGKKILVLEKDEKVKNDRTWCFWDQKNKTHQFPILKSWDALEIKSPEFYGVLPLGDLQYHMVRSQDFYQHALDTLRHQKHIDLVRDEIETMQETRESITLNGKKQQYHAAFVLSSVMDFQPQKESHTWLYQHFGGWFIKSEYPVFKNKNPMFMNFDVPQDGVTRFMYELPLNDYECLFEFTVFSGQVYPHDQYEQFLLQYLREQNISSYSITEKEFGVIPMTSYPFWKHHTKRKMYIGTAGGWTKPSTGYTFYFCQQNAYKLLDFLKKNNDMRKFTIKSLDYYLDQILLGVLAKHNQLGGQIFASMFQKNKVGRILKFLNNESSLWDKFLIVTRTKFPQYFFNSLLQILLKR